MTELEQACRDLNDAAMRVMKYQPQAGGQLKNAFREFYPAWDAMYKSLVRLVGADCLDHGNTEPESRMPRTRAELAEIIYEAISAARQPPEGGP